MIRNKEVHDDLYDTYFRLHSRFAKVIWRMLALSALIAVWRWGYDTDATRGNAVVMLTVLILGAGYAVYWIVSREHRINQAAKKKYQAQVNPEEDRIEREFFEIINRPVREKDDMPDDDLDTSHT